MSETLIEKEVIGVGVGSTFSSTLANTPMKPRSIKVFADYTTSVVSGVDNGAGSIVGNDISGTVNYSTGEIEITVTTSLPSGNQCYVSYSYFEYGITELNKVQYVQQDFQTTVEGIKALLRDNFQEDYNDYVTSSLGMALVDINAYAYQNLAWYLNRKVTDLYMTTAKSPNAVAKLARFLAYKPTGATGSIANLQVTLSEGPYLFPVSISAPFQFKGPNQLIFEYRGSTPIVYLPGEVLKTFDVYEGETVTETFVSDGTANLLIDLLKVPSDKFVGEASIVVTVDGEEWTEKPIIPFEADKYFEADIVAYPPTIKFGDGVQGLIPPAGAGISVTYVIVSGFSGRVAKESIDDVVNALTANLEAIPLDVYQPSASAGGDNPEDNRSITVNAPLFQKTQDRAVTKEDYDYLVGSFPNVAKSNAMVIRSISNDVTIQTFISQIEAIAAKMKQADRYLTPRPKIVTLDFSKDMFYGTEASLEVDGVPVSQAFDTDNVTTLESLADLIADEPNIESAILRSYEYGNVIAVTGIADADFVLSSLSTTEESAPVITKTEIQTAPNQIWRLEFDKDLFFGNVVYLEYNSVSITIPFDTDNETTLNALGDALAGFVTAPEASINEVSSAPNQATEIKFNKNFFLGCRVNFYLQNLAKSTVVETLVSVSFNTDNNQTFNDCVTALEGLSFVDSVVANTANRTLTIYTYSYRPSEISDETLAFGDASTTVFAFQLASIPVRQGTFFVKAGAITGTDNGSGIITGVGISGTINYTTGVVNVTFSVAPAVAEEIYCNYMYLDSSVTLEVTRVEVLTNTVTVDSDTNTIEIATSGANTVPLTGENVTALLAPTLSQTEIQSLITEDLGSIGSLADDVLSQKQVITDYLEDHFDDGCNANTVQVSVLSKDTSRKYVSPPLTLLDSIKTYLEERKDVTHAISTVSGIDKVIDVDIAVEVQVAFEALEDSVVQQIDNSIQGSDVKPYGIMIERDFDLSLYLSDIYDEIRSRVDSGDISYLNVTIEGPEIHPTGLIEDKTVDVGDGNPGQTVSYTLSELPIVKTSLKVSVDGTEIAEDNGTNEIEETAGSYGISGTINYSTGVLELSFTNAIPVDAPITVTFYKSTIDARGNFLCPSGYVLQPGTITISRLSRL